MSESNRNKKTKIGMIPDSWDFCRLEKYCHVKTGGTPSTKIPEYYDRHEIPWLKSAEVNKRIIFESDNFISRFGLENSSARLLPNKSVIIALSGQGKTRGKTSILEIEAACSQSVACMIPKNENKLSYKFLHYFLSKLYRYIRNLTGDIGREGLNLSLIRKFPLVVPSIEEQKKIVSILENVDNIIQTTQQLIETLQECKKGLMQRLFTEGIGHTEFKETKLGQIPKEWQVVKIKEVGKVITGKTPSTKNPKFWGEGYPFITPTDLKDTVYFGNYERTVTPKGASEGNLIPKNSVLVTCIASIGKSALVRKRCITNQQINSIICNEGINPKYIYYAIQYRKRYLELYANIAVVPIINKTLFELFKIPLQKKKEQDKIASIVFNLDNQIEIERKYIKELMIIKKGLMQILLTGKKRVPQ